MEMKTGIKAGLALALALSLTACQTTNTSTRVTSTSSGYFCEERPEVCLLVGGLIFGGVIAIASSGGGTNTAAPGTTPTPPPTTPPIVLPPGAGGGAIGALSDRRLKHDIIPVETLSNGLKTYAFKYNGDDRWFVGVMAQDLLADPRFKSAVKPTPDGFYTVDYAALGLKVVNLDLMQHAGTSALTRAL